MDPFGNLGSHTLLSKDEQLDLIRKAQGGCNRSMDKLVRHNFRLVRKLAAPHLKRLPDYEEDLTQEGLMGLHQAILKFDTESGYSLSTYATRWITMFITRYIYANNCTPFMNITVWFGQLRYKIYGVASRLESELGRPPTHEEISEAIQQDGSLSGQKATPEVVREAMSESLNCHTFSHFIHVGDDGDEISSLEMSICEEERSVNTGDTLVVEEHIAGLMLNVLNERERIIIIHRNGLWGCTIYTLEALATHFGLSRERVRQVEREALNKVTNHLQSGKPIKRGSVDEAMSYAVEIEGGTERQKPLEK